METASHTLFLQKSGCTPYPGHTVITRSESWATTSAFQYWHPEGINEAWADLCPFSASKRWEIDWESQISFCLSPGVPWYMAEPCLCGWERWRVGCSLRAKEADESSRATERRSLTKEVLTLSSPCLILKGYEAISGICLLYKGFECPEQCDIHQAKQERQLCKCISLTRVLLPSLTKPDLTPWDSHVE